MTTKNMPSSDMVFKEQVIYPRSSWIWVGLILFFSYGLYWLPLSLIAFFDEDSDVRIEFGIAALVIASPGLLFFLLNAIFAWSGSYYLKVNQHGIHWRTWRQNRSFNWEEVEAIRFNDDSDVFLEIKSVGNEDELSQVQIPDCFSLPTQEIFMILRRWERDMLLK